MRLPLQVGDYTFLEQLGAGGFGTVYRARIRGEMGFSQDVAVKLVGSDASRENPDLIQSLADEASFLSRLQHAHIVSVRRFLRVEHEVLGSIHLMEMELVRGLVMSKLITRLGESGTLLPVEAVLSILSEATEALVYAHALRRPDGGRLGLVHRDIKPANLMVTHDGRLKILDFGIAWAEDRLVESTESGLAKGTPLYMSPEQLHAEEVDARSDLYALGVVAFELLSGERFVPQSESRLELPALIMRVARTRWEDRMPALDATLTGAAPAGRGLREEQARPLRELLGRMLAHDPAGRPASAEVLAEELEELTSSWRLSLGRRYLRAAVDGLEPPVQPDEPTASLPAATPQDTSGDEQAVRTFATRLSEIPETRLHPHASAPGSRLPLFAALAGLAILAVGLTLWMRGGAEPVAAAPLDPDATPAVATPAVEPTPGPEPTPGAEPTPAAETPAPEKPSAPKKRPAPEPTPAPELTPAPKPAPVWPTLVGSPPGLVLPGNPLTLTVRVEGGDLACTPEVYVRSIDGAWSRKAMTARAGSWSAIMDIPYDGTWDGGAEYFFRCCDGGGRCGASLGTRSSPLRAEAPSF